MPERIHLTPEEWNKFCEIYLEEFEHAPRKQAFANACRRIRAEGGRVPSFKTLLRKLGKRRGSPTAQESAQESASPTDAGPIGPGMPEPRGPEGPLGDTPVLDDYRSRLELVVRLYRTRSESACDAVCDRLLPELEV